ncbi:hypothetical protein D7X88_01270 [bacterium C-53]|nr:hypothetical protein [Lachnospiraceae bacterium]NBI01651.1 hypothetical protein [Lachnospiraceae bacterium]RKJ12945.1 hypothetical protein D7X88_01270 [bacterium C-53]
MSMDINSVYSQYMNQAATDSYTKKLEGKTSDDYKNASDEELMDACKEFEAYFVEQMFKAMQKTVVKSDGSEDSMLVDYFKGNLMQEYAKTAVEQNDLGIAKMLYEQMKRNYSVESIE